VVLDAVRIALLIPFAEAWRRCAGPANCVTHFRRLGARRVPRHSAGRLQLRRLIRAIDVRLPDGGNCYRRALIEIALDPVSAREPLHIGLVHHGGPKSGHAWLESDPPAQRTYDAEFTM
jgi:hypothetical protein